MYALTVNDQAPLVLRCYVRADERCSDQEGGITDAVSIQERPPEAEDRAVPATGRKKLLAGSANTRIATLVEHHSRFVMSVKVDGKDTETVVAARARQQDVPVPNACRYSRRSRCVTG